MTFSGDNKRSPKMANPQYHVTKTKIIFVVICMKDFEMLTCLVTHDESYLLMVPYLHLPARVEKNI